jgi:hypothetical protein
MTSSAKWRELVRTQARLMQSGAILVCQSGGIVKRRDFLTSRDEKPFGFGVATPAESTRYKAT